MDESRSLIDRLLNVSTPHAPASEEEIQARLTRGRPSESDRMAEEDGISEATSSDSAGIPYTKETVTGSPVLPCPPPSISADINIGPAQGLEHSDSPSPDEGSDGDHTSPLQMQIEKAQIDAFLESIRTARIVVNSADSNVKVTADGNGRILEIHIDPSAAKMIRGEELGHAVVSGVNEVQARARIFRDNERAKLASGNDSHSPFT